MAHYFYIFANHILIVVTLFLGIESLSPQLYGESRIVVQQDKFQQATKLFEKGQDEHQKGNYEQAIAFYRESLKMEASLWEVEFQLGLANLALKRFSLAKESIDKVLRQLSKYSESKEIKEAMARSYTVLGEIAVTEAKPVEADQAFRQAIELNPQLSRPHAGIAELRFAERKFDQVISEAKIALTLGHRDFSTYELLIEALFAKQQYDEALKALNELLTQQPSSAPALRYRAKIFLQLGDFQDAIKDLYAVVSIESRLEDKLLIAELQSRLHQSKEAIASYQAILKEYPQNKEAQIALAVLLTEEGRAAEAIAQLEIVLQGQPNRSDVRAQLAELYLPVQPEKALKQYQLAAESDPANIAHQIGIGTALVKLRRFPEAISVLRNSLAVNPKDSLAYYAHTNLATALFEMDDFVNAAKEFIWILEHQADKQRKAVTLYFLGICFDKIGDLEQAQRAYQQFLGIAGPENQLEIDKVRLRLPVLKRQLEKGQGRPKKP